MTSPHPHVTIRDARDGDHDAVVELWTRSGLTRPWNDPYADIVRSSASPSGLLLVAVDESRDGTDGTDTDTDTHDAESADAADAPAARIVGSVMAGYDGHRGWLYYLATAASHRGAGIGRALVAEAERRLAAMGCPKVQLMVRGDNVSAVTFYDRLGYGPDDVRVLGRRLVIDEPSGSDSAPG
ncbi:GNAT family N-acetyltransferase [Mycetocola reblochoni]|uniref:GNAT family N-acetyltransferase n=2 Tax=Mycetocola reblochoni TaxID=331618 RepID=A0A3L6ZQ11_9MICO|nr:GNAT family N-acetyltransferase [Mycetocola reblochoni]RLP70006.1 GNAT family N-acetyltransferase [Mycetocola reblochoni]SJN29356.1 putative acetyltransferase [Mycetocola reblochoni REB411]